MAAPVSPGARGARVRARAALRPGVLALLAVLGTFATVMLLDPEPGPVVLGIALTVSLSRSQLERELRGRVEALAALPVLGLATVGVGLVLQHAPVLGAVLYVLALTGSVLLRLPGGVWRRIGGLVAMPFVALLVVPPAGSTRFGPVGAVLVPVVVSVVAWCWVTLVQLVAARLQPPLLRRIGAPRPGSGAPMRRSSSGGGSSGMRPSATARLALQLAVSTAAGFALGLTLFPTRWHWLVVTVVILTAGARGRADVLDKALHRLVGAALGTVLVLLVVVPAGPSPEVAVVLALAAVALGVLLRELAYGLWAFAITVALALVERLAGTPSPLVGLRLEEILIGAVVAVLPAIFLLPVRSADVVRSRLGALLRALSERLAATADQAQQADAAVAAALRELDLVARPFDELGALLGPLGRRGPVPGEWIRATRELATVAAAAPTPASGAARRALGEARRALREPDQLYDALLEAVSVLDEPGRASGTEEVG